MIGQGLLDLINQADNPPTVTQLPIIQQAISKARETNQKDLLSRACHQAIIHNQTTLLIILVINGDADFSVQECHMQIADLTADPHLKLVITQLQQEQHRRRSYVEQHLHDDAYLHLHDFMRYIASFAAHLAPDHEIYKMFKEAVQKRPNEINETSFWQQNACHLAVQLGLYQCLKIILAQNVESLLAKDLNDMTPLDYISNNVVPYLPSGRTKSPPFIDLPIQPPSQYKPQI